MGTHPRLSLPAQSRKVARGKKTDREDAMNNVDYFVAGKLQFVSVPTPEDEDAREMLRFRYDMVYKRTRQKQRILAMVRRSGTEYNLTKTNWTKAHYQWLRKVDLPINTRLILTMMLDELEAIEARLVQLEDSLEETFKASPSHNELLQFFKLIPGIGTLGGMTVILEGRDLSRFSHPGKFMNYTGLVPGKHASGERDPSLRITKAGNKYLRTALVGSGKFYRSPLFFIKAKKAGNLPGTAQGILDKMPNTPLRQIPQPLPERKA